MNRTLLWAGAGILVLALGWWVVEGLRRAPSRDAATINGIATPPPAAAPASSGTEPIATSEGGVAIELLLLPDQTVGAVPASVRIGVGHVSAEDAAAHSAWVMSGGEGAGPSSLAELAIVEHWVTAPAEVLPDRSVRVGPMRLPNADRYDLMARGDDELHFYATSFTPETIPATVAPLVGAGLRVQREASGAGDAGVLLRRVDTDSGHAIWQDLMQREAPELIDAFGETALPVGASQLLAPLPPGPIEVILQVQGVESERRALTLSAGQIVDLRFDAVAQAVAAAVSADLQLEFVARGSGDPIEGLQVVWLGERGEQKRVSDQRGRADFPDLDRQRTHRFNLQFAPPRDGLPEWPESRPLEVSLDAPAAAEAESPEVAATRVVHRRIELARLEWIIARVPAATDQRPRPFGSAYPIYLLQRERDGTWEDTAADHFIDTPEGLAVSVSEPGSFRIAVAESPWRMLYSTPIDTHASTQGKHFVSIVPVPGHAAEVTVLRNGAPLERVPIEVRGPGRGIPPESLTTDGEGRLVLDATTVPTIWIELTDSAEVAVDVQSTRTIATLDADVPRP